jgi:hypothetical protein
MVVFQYSNRIVAILAVLGCTLALANAQDVDEVSVTWHPKLPP